MAARLDRIHGDFFYAPKLEMSPPAPPIPVYVGGLSDIALRRAARYDGWIGDLTTIDTALEITDRIRRYRAAAELSMNDYTIMAPLTDAVTVADYARAESGGITHILTMPWMFYSGPAATTAEKIRDMERFRHDLKLDR